MKTSSRKRLLVSSVAMLLVAMLALGTATYAWFTQDTSARTKNLSVHTSKSSSLEISKSTGGWQTEVDYGFADKLLIPTTSFNGTDWFTATAANEAAYNALTGGVSKVELTNGKNETYFIKNQLNIRNAGDAKVGNVKIKFSIPSSADYDYVRVALVETTTQGENVANKGTFATSIYDNKSENSFTMQDLDNNSETPDVKVPARTYKSIKAVKGTGESQTVTYSDDITPTSSDTGSFEINVKDLNAKVVGEGGTVTYDAVYYNLYVWFEGQDSQCYNANAGAIVPDIVFNVTGETVE